MNTSFLNAKCECGDDTKKKFFWKENMTPHCFSLNNTRRAAFTFIRTCCLSFTRRQLPLKFTKHRYCFSNDDNAFVRSFDLFVCKTAVRRKNIGWRLMKTTKKKSDTWIRSITFGFFILSVHSSTQPFQKHLTIHLVAVGSRFLPSNAPPTILESRPTPSIQPAFSRNNLAVRWGIGEQ